MKIGPRKEMQQPTRFLTRIENQFVFRRKTKKKDVIRRNLSKKEYCHCTENEQIRIIPLRSI